MLKWVLLILSVVGKDTILEEGRKLYEVLDLKCGKCRMCVAGPKEAKERLNDGSLIRVAQSILALQRIIL